MRMNKMLGFGEIIYLTHLFPGLRASFTLATSWVIRLQPIRIYSFPTRICWIREATLSINCPAWESLKGRKTLKECDAIKYLLDFKSPWNSEIQTWESLFSSCSNETICCINEYRSPRKVAVLSRSVCVKGISRGELVTQLSLIYVVF